MLAIFDGMLLSAIVWLAWRSIADRDLFRAAVQFVALGLLIAVAWMRLRAPDVALAEAAVGAGLTGALVLAAIPPARSDISSGDSHGTKAASRVAGLLSLGLFGLIGGAVLSLPSSPNGLTAESLAQLPRSGVSNPVTAVLLNYRGYDTLLEIGVLLLAIVGVWSLRRGSAPPPNLAGRELLLSFARWVLPLLVLAGGYLLWIGAFAPGGAFQGGALLGGAAVIALVSGLAAPVLQRRALLRAGMALGLAVFVAVAGGVMFVTGGLLEYPADQAKNWILVIESAVMISIGLTLGGLFFGGRPVDASSTDSAADA